MRHTTYTRWGYIGSWHHTEEAEHTFCSTARLDMN